ncbi:MAG TPA: GNAT family N-acetyltransferase [Candidatus Binataceae bacterium]|nr:GNAT family N-acetyltransferase [Candidatus Binataceae bacterium]
MISRAPDVSLYHNPQWHRVLEQTYGINFIAAIVEDNSTPVAGCMLARPRNPLSRRLIGLPFSDYCAPLSLRPGGAQLLTEMLAAQLRAQGQSCELRGAAAPPPWKTVDTFVNWTLELNHPAETILGAIRGNFRRAARRAREDGVMMSHDSSQDYASRFYLQHLENRRRFGLPAQPWRFFRRVAEIMGEGGNFEVWLATAGGRDVGSVVLLKDRATLYCKWTARAPDAPTGAMQLLFWSICEQYAGAFDTFDLGRTDARNDGLASFKRYLGANPAPLPYSFYPDTNTHVSAEHLTGPAVWLAAVWRHLPLNVARVIGGALYGYLT